MKRLAKIVRSATPSTGVQFRPSEYGSAAAREFLRDIIAIANAPVEGPRYIIVGAEIDAKGRKRVREIDRDDFTGNPSYQALAHSETLRRGDAYMRANDRAVKMGRRQLQSLFEQKFRESVSDASIEIGFPGEIIHKDRKVPVHDLSQLPSAIATAKLKQLIDIKSGMKSSGSTTMVARLTHARLFGTDSPYEDRSPDELAAEMREIRQRYRSQDEHFLFEQHSEELQFVVYNQGEDVIRDASLSLVLPNHADFYVASQLPKILQDDRFVDRTPAEQAEYPSVSLSDDSVQVSGKLGDIPSGELMEVFTAPLRICVGNDLSGRRFGVQYSLFAKNLRAPARGKLRLLF
jgi:hypothetical protein